MNNKLFYNMATPKDWFFTEEEQKEMFKQWEEDTKYQIENFAQKAIIPYTIRHKGERYDFECKIRYKWNNIYLDPFQVFQSTWYFFKREVKQHCKELKKKTTYKEIEREFEECVNHYIDLFLDENTDYNNNFQGV